MAYFHILALQVSVEDVVLVDMSKGKTDLNEQLHDLFLGEAAMRVLPLLDEHGQVSSISVLHHDEELIILDETLTMLNNVRVSHLT